MVSNLDWGGLLLIVVDGFELGGWHVVAVRVQPVVVEPVDPAEGGEFELVDVVPAVVGVGPVDALGIVEAVRRLSQRIAVAVCNSADARQQCRSRRGVR